MPIILLPSLYYVCACIISCHSRIVEFEYLPIICIYIYIYDCQEDGRLQQKRRVVYAATTPHIMDLYAEQGITNLRLYIADEME